MSANPPRVLVVARRSFADPVIEALRREAVTAEWAAELRLDAVGTYAVVVVDVGLGDWRAIRDAGVAVILFADHADCDTITAALAHGADDVITRADRPHEAAARIRAVARRRPAPTTNVVLRVGDVELDPDARKVSVAGEAVALTRKQFDLLDFFLRNAGRVVTRASLRDHVWDIGAAPDLNAVEIQVRRLREAIGDDPRRPIRLRTVRGVGYLYERN